MNSTIEKMRQIKLWLITIAMLLCSGTIKAYDFELDGFYYEITDIGKLTVSIVKPKVWNTSSPYEGDIKVPSTITYEGEEFIVTSIGSGAFSYASITSIILPETLHRIEGSAFLGAGITSVIIPKDVEYIGTSAFGNCKKLKEIFFLHHTTLRSLTLLQTE